MFGATYDKAYHHSSGTQHKVRLRLRSIKKLRSINTQERDRAQCLIFKLVLVWFVPCKCKLMIEVPAVYDRVPRHRHKR